MSSIFLKKIFIFLLSICFLLKLSSANEAIQVTIESGQIIGQRIYDEHGRLFDQFLGIPYAQPPIGHRRFHRPEPIEKLNQQPYEALEWPPMCLQNNPWEKNSSYHNFNQNEDCLYLNVWSPKVDVNNENELRPVLVYIHGGGLIIGSSGYKHLEGRTVTTMANVVVVSFNYRLSIFGLLYSDEVEHIKGNMAFWDQALALEWVQQNIRYFGGDPKQVTIAGCSAGAWSISAHILSPITRNLYKNAIMLSGSIQNLVISREDFRDAWLNRIRAAGCATDSDHSISQKMIDCLNQMNENELVKVIDMDSFIFTDYAFVDGEFFPDHPNNMLRDGNHKKNFNLLISTDKDEGSPFSLLFLTLLNRAEDGQKFAFINPEPLDSLDEAKEILATVIKPLTSKKNNVPIDQLSKIYFNGLNPKTDHPDLLRETVSVVLGDMWLTCPTIDFGHILHRNGNVNVYQIYHTYKQMKTNEWCPKWSGTCHGDDEFTMLGDPIRHPSKYNQRIRDISMELISFLHSFLRNGQPNQNEQPEWQSFFDVDDIDGSKITVRPYYELSNEYRTHESYGIDLKQRECQFLKQFYEYHDDE
uniref:Carboxylic ester hydrolase n=1 Tax=Dermatophagoides pteronyssinus TaxID=6956 RepID=A0A6P6XYS2_DERPT|nr:cholinesterase 1-like [Dermatophagoides pteronyssinus]